MASLAAGEHARMYALAGVMRAGASRAGYVSPTTFVSIGGVQYAAARAVDGEQVENETLTITETEGETANTASFDVRGFVPTNGQEVVITLGSINNGDRLFGGLVLTDRHGSVGTPVNGRDTVNVIDYTWHLTRDTISQRWQTASGTVIARAIIAHANRGFTSLLVEEGLPVLDEFTVTNQTHASALSNLCDRLGATWKATYHKDVQLGLTANVGQTDPTTLTAASALLTGMEELKVTRDLSQVITRQPVEGGGSDAITDVGVGDTILPVTVPDWYNAAGGIVATGPQRLTYTGLQLGGEGSLVGPGAAPSVAPVLALRVGAGLGLGVYQYGVVFGTAAGKSVPGPLRIVTTSANPAPTVAPTVADDTSNATGLFTAGDTITYTYSYSQATLSTDFTAESVQSSASGAHTVIAAAVPPFPPGTAAALDVTVTYSTDAAVKWIHIFRSRNGGAYVQFLQVMANNSAGGTVVFIDGGVGSASVPSGGAVQQVAITVVPLGPTGTTYREIYRTAVGGAQLKLQQTIANNTATVGVQDATADGSLGANAPTSDTSGLTQPSGQVNAGSATLLLAGAGPFSATGGWTTTGIRYTGITGNTLTGIPAAGIGSIATTLVYGTAILAAPALTGIPASGAGSILYPIKQGDPVNLRVVLDDLAAQAVIAALMLPLIDDGIIEGAVIQDGRISETEARARGTAQLALRSALAVAVDLQSKDCNMHAGRTLSVNLPAPHPYDTVGSYKVQSVSIGNFQPALYPTRTVHAAARLFTLAALLRQTRAAGGA